MLLIGLMSGTSVDGIDAALAEIDGAGRDINVRLIHFVCLPHEPSMREAVLALCDPATGTVPDLCALHAALGEKFAEAALRLADEAGVEMREITAIASHGQTVWHQPEPVDIGGISARGTLQIGSPAVIAARTGCQVVADFRAADMAAGGQGAPLVPYFDWAVLGSDTESRAVLNVGGIANVTYLRRGAKLDSVVAFDTGPGNMLIDAAVSHYTHGEVVYDDGGEWAARGAWSPELGGPLLQHPFFEEQPPKSTGRETFGRRYVEDVLRRAQALAISPEDAIATLTELTARTIAESVRRWLPPVDRLIAGGGGCHNRTLMRLLRDHLSPVAVSTHDEFGIRGDAKEAMAFALLGYETLHGRPSNVPSATGARYSAVLGSVTASPPLAPLQDKQFR